MAPLIAAKCPTCGAGLQIDPAAEFVLCQYCSTSSFVRTPTRPVSPRVLLEHSPVIDLTRPRYAWLIVVAGMVTLAVVVAIGAVLIKIARSQMPPPAPPAPALPKSAAPELAVAAPSASTPIREDSAPSQNAPDRSSTARPASSAGRKPGSTPAATAKAAHGRVATGAITVSGWLEPAKVRAVVGGNTARFRMCYEQGLARSSTLAGRVSVRFVIGRDGTVSNVSDSGSDLADESVKSCVLRAFYGLNFPVPENGIVTVVYPLIFRPEP